MTWVAVMGAPRRDLRFWLLLAALLLLAAALVLPPLPSTRPVVRVLAVVDITGSMNTRDAGPADRPVSRLEAAKAALRQLLQALPCGSTLGLAMFTERQSFPMFEPVEVCDDFAPLDTAIAALDWRMAWEGDSYIAEGLGSALGLARSLESDLLFLTDGHQAPPLPEGTAADFGDAPGSVKGLVVGVGGYALSPIPKFDDEGREVGFYGVADVPHEARIGPPPAGAENREGWNPRNAPWGGAASTGTEHLSSVREAYLTQLAGAAKLGYAHLDQPPSLLPALRAVATPRRAASPLDLRPVPALLALLLLVVVYGLLPALARRPIRSPH